MRPLLPALLCAAGVVVVAFLVEGAVRAVAPEPSPWILLACQVPPMAIFTGLYALFAPFESLRIVVRDITKDLAPPFVKRWAWARAYWKEPTSQGLRP